MRTLLDTACTKINWVRILALQNGFLLFVNLLLILWFGSLGIIVTSFQDFKSLKKRISPTFSYFLINNALLYHFLVNWLAHNEKITDKSVFRELSFKFWNDVAIVPSFLFLVSRFCTPPEETFYVFGTSKRGVRKSLSNNFLLYLSRYIGEILSSK